MAGGRQRGGDSTRRKKKAEKAHASSDQDSAWAALMSEMKGGTDSMTTTTKTESQHRQRLLPELPAYPANGFLAGSQSIWNPYVRMESSKRQQLAAACTSPPVLPTNPQVEAIRRRVYEGFKANAQEMVQRVEKKMNEKVVGVSPKLPVPSMLEKAHMDAKVEEAMSYELHASRSKGEERKSQTDAFIPAWGSTFDIYTLSKQLPVRPAGANPLNKSWNHWFDPLLPNRSNIEPFYNQIRDECQKASKDSAKAVKFGKRLAFKLLCETVEAWQKQLSQVGLGRVGTSHKHPMIKFEDDMVAVSHVGLVFRLHETHYRKLQRLFDRAAPQDVRFADALFCLLCRYDTLQGAGLQAAVPGAVMDVLLMRWDCRMECFASPLNCRYETFGSAFGQLDCAFGSIGSFFDVPVGSWPSGTYQANPPFCESIISLLAERLTAHVKAASCNGRVRFVVFVPVWADSPGYKRLRAGASHELRLEASSHWYAEGTQHRRAAQFRVASFDTSVFVYDSAVVTKRGDLKIVGGSSSATNQNDHTAVDENDREILDVLEELKAAFERDPLSEPAISEPTIASSPSKDDSQRAPGSPVAMPKAAVSTAEEEPAKKSEQEPTSAKSSQSKDKQKRQKKRKWTDEEEGRAQLNLLQSLGLSGGDDGSAGEAKVMEVGKKKKGQKRRR